MKLTIRCATASVLFAVISSYSASVTAVAKAGSVSVRVTGLANGEKLSLLNNGRDSLEIRKNGEFSFKEKSGSGAEFNVTVSAQPESVRCIVVGGTGVINAKSKINITVTCPIARRNSLVWLRCSHGQQWNAAAGNCTATGKAPAFGAQQLRFCATNDNMCNGGSEGGTLASGDVFDACNQLNTGDGKYGIKTWRVPASEELRLLVICTDGTPVPLKDYGTDPYKCGLKGKNYVNGSWKAPALDQGLFPNSMSLEYWSSSSDGKNKASAWYTAFQNGWTHRASKANRSYVRCVSSSE